MRLDEIHPGISLSERAYARQNTFPTHFSGSLPKSTTWRLSISLVHPCTKLVPVLSGRTLVGDQSLFGCLKGRVDLGVSVRTRNERRFEC